MVLTIQLASMVKCREFLAQPPSDKAIKRARLTFLVLDLLFGLAWAINLARPTDDHTSSDIINVFAMLLVVAVSSMLGSSLPIAVFATTAPLTIAVAVNYLFTGSVHGYVLAGSRSPRSAISDCSPTGSTPRTSRPSRHAPKRMR